MRLPLPSLFFFSPPIKRLWINFMPYKCCLPSWVWNICCSLPSASWAFSCSPTHSGFFFFFFLPSKKGDFIKTLVAAQHLLWERSIAHDAPPPKKKTEKNRAGAHSSSFLPLMARDVATLYCSFNQQSQIVPQSVSCIQRLLGVPAMILFQFFWVFFFLSRGNLFLRSEETLPSITIHAICKSFMKHPYFSGTSNRPNEKPSPARSRASHFHFSPLVTATVPGAVGFKVILKRPIITDTPRGFHAAPR